MLRCECQHDADSFLPVHWRALFALSLSARHFFEVGVKLQKFLDDSGMTSGELAREIGVTQKAVYYWLNEGRSPRPNNIRAVSKATNGAVTAMDWFDGE